MLLQYENFKYLTEFAGDLDSPGMVASKIRLFYVLLRGNLAPLKKWILNYTLLLFSSSFMKKEFTHHDLSDPRVFANAQYEPGTVDMYFKCLFSVFAQNGICYRKDNDFNQTGDFLGYWKDTFAISQEQRSDYGTRPNASTFDSTYKVKRQAAVAKGVLTAFTNYTHHTWILLEDFLTHNMLHGSQEPVHVTRDDIIHGIIPPGIISAGCRFYRLRSHHSGQKGNALTLKNTAVENEKNANAYVPMVEDPNDPLCLYSLL